jgi:hypothetical protein
MLVLCDLLVPFSLVPCSLIPFSLVFFSLVPFCLVCKCGFLTIKLLVQSVLRIRIRCLFDP